MVFAPTTAIATHVVIRTYFSAAYVGVWYAMWQVLIDRTRNDRAAERRGKTSRVELDVVVEQIEDSAGFALLDLDAAMTNLGAQSQRQLQVTEMRYFANMELAEIAAELKCSVATVKRELKAAKIMLSNALDSDD